MRAVALILLAAAAVALQNPMEPKPATASASVAEVYYWKAKPAKLDEYNRYIREYAQPIDMEAQRQGAFISVTTLVATNPDCPWTHMRIFILRDRAQAAGLSAALDAAKLRLHPDEADRQGKAQYAETLRDLVGHELLDVMP